MKTLMLIMLLLSGFATAEPQISELQLTTFIQQRQPVDNLNHQVLIEKGQIGKVYFYTRAENLANKQIIHRWLYQGQHKADVTLTIGSQNWRTYSSKRIRPDWTGKWQVQVLVDEQIIARYDFDVQLSDTEDTATNQ
ncbi:DUF2914 domain-containing protein [Neptunicella sp. SCSIO 80796]|uniref:DUF2914 domain-containing protein n=1 Tax=Neptunicella plasticusilytica TaxID=3117012 RepID=UPI003A4DC06D